MNRAAIPSEYLVDALVDALTGADDRPYDLVQMVTIPTPTRAYRYWFADGGLYVDTPLYSILFGSPPHITAREATAGDPWRWFYLTIGPVGVGSSRTRGHKVNVAHIAAMCARYRSQPWETLPLVVREFIGGFAADLQGIEDTLDAYAALGFEDVPPILERLIAAAQTGAGEDPEAVV